MYDIVSGFKALIATLALNPLRSNEIDTGQEQRVDGSIRVFLGGRCSNSYRQLYGDINTKTGQRIDNAKDRWDKSQLLVQALAEKYNNDPSAIAGDPEAAMAVHWAAVNEQRFNLYKEVLESDKAIYKEITGEDWEHTQTSGSASTVRKIDPSKLTQEQKDRIAACFAKAKVA